MDRASDFPSIGCRRIFALFKARAIILSSRQVAKKMAIRQEVADRRLTWLVRNDFLIEEAVAGERYFCLYGFGPFHGEERKATDGELIFSSEEELDEQFGCGGQARAFRVRESAASPPEAKGAGGVNKATCRRARFEIGSFSPQRSDRRSC